MDLGSWLMVGFLGGAFLFGIWFMLVREDDRSSRTMTIHRQDLTVAEPLIFLLLIMSLTAN